MCDTSFPEREVELPERKVINIGSGAAPCRSASAGRRLEAEREPDGLAPVNGRRKAHHLAHAPGRQRGAVHPHRARLGMAKGDESAAVFGGQVAQAWQFILRHLEQAKVRGRSSPKRR
jgi:hypothetical protein